MKPPADQELIKWVADWIENKKILEITTAEGFKRCCYAQDAKRGAETTFGPE